MALVIDYIYNRKSTLHKNSIIYTHFSIRDLRWSLVEPLEGTRDRITIFPRNYLLYIDTYILRKIKYQDRPFGIRH